MSDREPRRPFASQPEDDRSIPDERSSDRPARRRGGDPSRLFRPAPEPLRADPSSEFPWRVDESAADRLRRPQEERAARTERARLMDPDGGFAFSGSGDRRPESSVVVDPDPRSSGDTADRRGRGNAPARVLPPTDDPTDPTAWSDVTEAWAADTDQGWDESDGPPLVEPSPVPTAAPAQPARTARTARTARERTRARTAGRSAARPSFGVGVPEMRLPTFVSGSDLIRDRTALGLLGAAALGLAVMALLLATRMPDLAPSQVLHLDASGRPDLWGPPRVLWRIPLLVAMTTLLNLGLAWWISRFDRFAARFLLAAALVVQLVAWVALFDFV